MVSSDRDTDAQNEVQFLSLNKEVIMKLPTPIPETPLDPNVEHKLRYTWLLSEMTTPDKPGFGMFLCFKM